MNIFSFRFLHMWLKTLLVIGHNEHSRVILGFHGFMSFTATASILLLLSPAISVLMACHLGIGIVTAIIPYITEIKDFF